MKKTSHADAAPLNLWEVLEEELVALGGVIPPEYLAVKERYRNLRCAVSEGPQKAGARTSAEYQQAIEERDRAEREYVRFLFELLHEKRNTALCFSGGGIRSATFGLGVLHGLAHHSADHGTPTPPRLLGEFDYVSTVSGGGFLGSWLSAWRYWDADGMRGVVRALAATATSKLDPEPQPLRHLRNYTAYLNPRTGLFSADTWTLGGTVVRNILLNWTVILPLIAAALMIPQLALAVMHLPPAGGLLLTREQLLLALLAAGFLSIVLPTANMARTLPSIGGRPVTQQQYFANVLIPMSVAAVLLSIYWVWHLGISKSTYSVGQFVKVGVAAHSAGAVLGAIVIFYESTLMRVALSAAGLAIGMAAWWLGGFWLAIIVITALCAALFRRHIRTVANALAAAIATGAAGGACAYALATGPLDPRTMGNDLRPYACFAFPAVLTIFGLVMMFLVAATSKVTSDDDREWWARSGAWILLVVVGWIAFSSVVLYAPDLFRGLEAAVAAAGGVTGIVASRLGFSGRTTSGRRDDASAREASAADAPSKLQSVALKIAAPAALILLVLLVALANDWLLRNAAVWLPGGVAAHLGGGASGAVTVRLVLAVTLLLVLPAVSLAFLVNINVFSLHGMYRSRLIRAYLGASNPRRRANPFTGFDPRDNMQMTQLGRQKGTSAGSPSAVERPLHVVNIALNLVKGENLAWQQRKAESFTVTPLHAGSCRVGYQRADRYGDTTGIDLGTVMTISGAAASPNQGYHSSPLVTLLMALFNARLEWWLANPGLQGRGKWRLAGPRWAVMPWINEAFGRTTDRSGWVYLSDGGHFENLGLYEMVLRRCRVIVVVDASADGDYALEDLGNAVRKIRIDFGIPVEFPYGLPIRSRLDPANAHCAVGEVQYRCVDGHRTGTGRKIKDGVLIYIKPALNGNEPPDVSHYASVDKRFPQQPTADQWFDEAQFESYRRLGAHSIDEIMRGARCCTLAQFVRYARRHARAAGAAAV